MTLVRERRGEKPDSKLVPSMEDSSDDTDQNTDVPASYKIL